MSFSPASSASYSRRARIPLDLFCVGMLLLHLTVTWLARRQILAGFQDFKIFYTAGLILRRGEGHILYNDALQLATQREFVSMPTTDSSPLPYNHPPFEAILFVPFTYLTFFQAYCLWLLISALLLAFSVYTIRPWLPAIAADFPEIPFLAPLAFFPVAFAFMEGQDSILLLTLYCLAYAALRKGHDLRAGVWLGLGLFKFHLVIPFAFILLLLRRWRAMGGFVLSACFVFAVSWALVGWEELLNYPRYVWHVNRLQGKAMIFPESMPNLRGLLTGWNQSPLVRSRLEILLLVASVGLLVWASRQWTPGDSRNSRAWDSGFSLAVISSFLVGYHGYNQDLSFILPALLLTLNRLLQSRSARDWGLWTLLALAFLSPLHLVLTLRYHRQNLFALALIALVFSLAANRSKPKQIADVTAP